MENNPLVILNAHHLEDLGAGPVMPYQNSGDITLNDGSDPLNKFMMAGIEFTQGVRGLHIFYDFFRASQRLS